MFERFFLTQEKLRIKKKKIKCEIAYKKCFIFLYILVYGINKAKANLGYMSFKRIPNPKSQDFAQSQNMFARSHDCETVTFTNSGYFLVWLGSS